MQREATRVLDEYLVAAARTGDRKAFGLLAERWQPKLVAHAWRLTGNRDAALEAVQAGWIEIVRGMAQLRDDRAFPAWAYRIVSRRCARGIGEAVRSRELQADLACLPEEIPAEPGGSIDADRLRAAIARLPGEQRSAVALFYLEELSVAEVAVALAIPAGTVKSRLLHARRKLRDVLEGEK